MTQEVLGSAEESAPQANHTLLDEGVARKPAPDVGIVADVADSAPVRNIAACLKNGEWCIP